MFSSKSLQLFVLFIITTLSAFGQNNGLRNRPQTEHDNRGRVVQSRRQESTQVNNYVPKRVDPDIIFFPDQIDYIRLHNEFCKSDTTLVYHPGSGRCFTRGSQGPCYDNQAFDLDPLKFLPMCRDTLVS